MNAPRDLSKIGQTATVIRGMAAGTPGPMEATTPPIPPKPSPMSGANGVANGRKVG